MQGMSNEQADRNILDHATLEQSVTDDKPLQQAHDAATQAAASVGRTSSTSRSPFPDLEDPQRQDDDDNMLGPICVDDLRDKCFDKMISALANGHLDKLFVDMADEKKTLPDTADDEPEGDVDCLRLRVLGRLADALDSGELDKAFDSLTADKINDSGTLPVATEETPRRSKHRASLTQMPPPVPILTTEIERAQRASQEVTSPAPDKKRLSASDTLPGVPTRSDVEASEVEPVKMRSRCRASLSEVPPDVPGHQAQGAAASKQEVNSRTAEETPPMDEQALEAQLPVLARDVLIEASVDGRLAAALLASDNDEEVAKAMANAPSNASAPAVGSNAAPTPPVQAIEASCAPPAAVQAFDSSSTSAMAPNSAMTTVLDAVAQRDHRVGELLAMISQVKKRIAEREERCSEIEDKLSAARADRAHLELDVEWYKGALDGARDRNGALEKRKRKLLGELDGYTFKSRHAGIDALECGYAYAPSEVSTATGGGIQSSVGCFTLGTGESLPSDISPRQ